MEEQTAQDIKNMRRIKDYNNFVSTADQFLAIGRMIESEQAELRHLERNYEYLVKNQKKNEQAEKMLKENGGAMLLRTVQMEMKISEYMTRRNQLRAQLHADHLLLVGTGHKDGQHTFRVPYCRKVGDRVIAPLYTETKGLKFASFTRHIKGGKGSAIIFGNLLPAMSY